MSTYSNFISDFPTRSGDLLNRFESRAKANNLEVTLMLTTAALSLIIPTERLRPFDTKEHPSSDHKRYPEARVKMQTLFKQSFLGSDLWQEKDPSSWAFGKLADVNKVPDFCPEFLNPKSLSQGKEIGTIIKHMRNALAHGNLFTQGFISIEKIIFLSQVNKNWDFDKHADPKFSYLLVKPSDFRKFIRNWLVFVDQLNMPIGISALPPYEAA